MYTTLLLLVVFSCSFCYAVPGDISQEKCKEYDENTSFKEEYIPVFSADETAQVKTSTCFIKPTFVSGGEDAEKGEFPHMALIGFKKDNKLDWVCGGSLISEEYVLTAAHCVNTKKTTIVHLGALNGDDKDVQEFEVSIAIRHPNFKAGVRYDDIALMKLPSKAEFNTNVRPACLHTGAVENDKFVISGWGQLNSTKGSKASNVLQKATIDRFSSQECTEFFGSSSVKENSTICAGGINNNTDTCPGDSGGPLQVSNTNTACMYSIVGITSFGAEYCGTPGVPAVYTRVSHYIDWIEKIVWG